MPFKISLYIDNAISQRDELPTETFASVIHQSPVIYTVDEALLVEGTYVF